MTQYNSDFLNILDERGFINQGTDFEGLDETLENSMVTAYCGYDPTADSLHVGHLVTIMMLYWLQHCGHRPLTLMGGATGLVGDPSFKDDARPLMSEEQIDSNIDGMQSVFGHILDYDSGKKNSAEMLNNADWLKDLGYIEFLRTTGRHFSVNRMLSFESVKRRLDREQNLSFLEFNYMLMQAYDFAELYRTHECRLQISGADQWGNIVNGVELGRRTEGVTLFGLTAPLLTTASGKKMGKSEGNAVWLNPDKLSHFDFYQFWRNVEDADVERFLKIFTPLPLKQIEKLAALEGQAINDAKKVLAFEVTKLVRGAAAAKEAETTALETFEQGEASEGLPMIELDATALEAKRYIDLYVEVGLTDSKGEARRLIKGGGARINDEKMADELREASVNDADPEGVIKLSAGKKRHALIRIKNR